MKRKIIIGLIAFTILIAGIIFMFPQYFSDNKIHILITHYDYRRGYLELSGIAENIGKEPIKYNPPLYVKVFDEKNNFITESNISLMPIQPDNPDVTPATFGEFDCLIKIPSGYGYVNWELTIDKVPYQVTQKNKPLTE
ncbi:MAG: hypothetical protein HY819_18815 [Acidobacteria bacterium]|nr:hypothetical protein [Acidobacteriota bacterium]